MKFEFEGHTHYLEFQREHRDVTIHRKGGSFTVKSKYPFTTVRLLQRKGDDSKPFVIKDYTVGCLPTDKYSNEKGRLEALRGLTDGLSKQLKEAIWTAYKNRAIIVPKEVSNT